MPAGASPAISVELQTPGPLITFSFSPSFFGHNVATTTLSSGGTPALALAVAGSFGPGPAFGSNHNTAVADVTSPAASGIAPDAAAIALAGTGAFEGNSHNTATAVSQGLSFSLAAAGNGFFAGDSHNTASALSFDGAAIALAGNGSFAGDSHNSASAIAFGGAVTGLTTPSNVVTFVPSFALAIAGDGSFAHLVDNTARASALNGGTSIALAAVGDHHSSGNTAIATSSLSLFNIFGGPGGAFAIAGEGDDNTAIAGANGVAGVAPVALSFAAAGRGDGNMAVAGSVLGTSVALAGQGDDNEAGAQADLGGTAISVAGDGDGNAAFSGASGPAAAESVATDAGSAVGASSTVGGTSFADASGGVWAVSLNGGTVIS
jgi:hypothetical protein